MQYWPVGNRKRKREKSDKKTDGDKKVQWGGSQKSRTL